MALINCSECGNQVSSIAASCPKCGAPITSVTTKDFNVIGTQITTVQETSKKLKLHVLIAVFLIFMGIIFAIINKNGIKTGPIPAFCLPLVLYGI